MIINQDSVETVARAFAVELGIRRLKPLSAQPPHHAFNAGDKYVIKVIITERPATEITKLSERIDLIRQLNEHGAKVMEVIAGPTARRGVIVLATPFYSRALPNNSVGYAAFGKALASLHTAGRELHSTASALKIVDPLPVIWETLRYLQECDRRGKPFSIGHARFPKDALTVFERHLVCAQTAYEEMVRITKQEDRFTIIYQDVHPGNVRLDDDNSPRIIDLLDNLVKGPPEYDLARPTAHWVHRIKRNPRLFDAFMDGYRHQTSGYPIDDNTLQLAIVIADTYYATSMLKNAVRSHKLGKPSVNEWQITDAVDRIRHLDTPSYPWRSTI